MSSTAVHPVPRSKYRLQSVDALRGLIMIVMALDHVRDFVHNGAMLFSPEDLTRTTPALFFTRWITHICAPVFMLTGGIGAFLWLQRGRTKAELSAFLWKRGLWLILLELTVMRLALNFSLGGGPILLIVLWALGACMIALSLLIHLPDRVLIGFSIALIAFHNCFDGVRSGSLGAWSGLWKILHEQGALALGGGILAVVAYPLVPWIAVMSCGFALGRVFLLEPEVRRPFLLRLGACLTLAFFAIRAINIYGDPVRWSAQSSGVYKLLSFLGTAKYPPSLDFLLMTLGPALLLLACLDGVRFATSNPLIVFGRVPLFFFVGHFFLAHAIADLLVWFTYGNRSLLFGPFPSSGGQRDQFPPDFGYDLWVVYAVWISVVLLMYPLCRWFAGVKDRRGDWWLSYL